MDQNFCLLSSIIFASSCPEMNNPPYQIFRKKILCKNITFKPYTMNIPHHKSNHPKGKTTKTTELI